MAYTVKNFKTKKELKEAVAKWKADQLNDVKINTNTVRCYQPGLGADFHLRYKLHKFRCDLIR